jgi:hypothetical protein
MTAKTCAACDCELDASPIRVRIGGNVVEVCCDECARALRETQNGVSERRAGDGD